MNRWAGNISKLVSAFVKEPAQSTRLVSSVPTALQSRQLVKEWDRGSESAAIAQPQPADSNPLWKYFDQHQKGPGIWKWTHYFDVYHQHLKKFIGQEVHLVEIGIYSGGSLPMWRDYLGPQCHIYGVDIAPECRAYEAEGIRVFIGDQADRSFWKRFRDEVPRVDIVIDDGGHLPHQQIATLEELLPHLSPEGVFICEDIHGSDNPFGAYLNGLLDSLNAGRPSANPELSIATSAFQAWIQGIHHYPFISVIEKRKKPIQRLVAPKRGTQWQPFKL